jgi:hypothetical protein
MNNINKEARPLFMNLENIIDSDNKASLSSSVRVVTIGGEATTQVDESLLNKLAFGNMHSFFVAYTNLTRIEANVFDGFDKLRYISFVLYNFREFITSSSNEWFDALNKDVHVSVKNASSGAVATDYNGREILIDFYNTLDTRRYDFPDADFCHFRRFPVDRLVFAVVAQDYSFESCSCTLYWLIQNVHMAPHDFGLLNTSTIHNCLKDLDRNVDECDFERRLNECDSIKRSNNESSSDASLLIFSLTVTLLAATTAAFTVYYMLKIRNNSLNNKYESLTINR